MISDRVGDFIIRLQNAAAIGTREVTIPRSGHLVAIAGKLRELGYLESVADGDPSNPSGHGRAFSVTLRYDGAGHARLHGVKRISKPGRRLYVPTAAAHSVKGGAGARIISSSKGIVSDSEARKNRLGGEALFEIW